MHELINERINNWMSAKQPEKWKEWNKMPKLAKNGKELTFCDNPIEGHEFL